MRGVWADGRGVERPPLHDRGSARKFLLEFRSHFQDALDRGFTRLHVNTMVTQEGLLALRHEKYARSVVEAITPLDNRLDAKKLFWVQFGLSTSERSQKSLSQSEVLQLASQLEQEKPWPYHAFLDRVPDEYEFEVLQEPSDQDYEDLALLWERFGSTPEEIEYYLTSPYNSVRVARFDSHIVATARLEITPFSQGGYHFQTAEHTDAATHSDHEGKGLYAALLAQTQRWLHTLEQPPDIMYGTSNVDQPQVLRLAQRMGRKSALQDGFDQGFPYSGFLRQDAPIVVAGSELAYRDLLMTYHTPSSLADWMHSSHMSALR